MLTKTCKTCKKELPVKSFHRDKNNKDGLKGRCRKCIYEYSKRLYANGGHYRLLKKRRESVKNKHNIGPGTLWRYGLRLSLLIYTLDNWRCRICHSKNDLTIDHIDRRGSNYREKNWKPNNSINNLRILCRKCHGSISGKNNRIGLRSSQAA